MEGSALAKERRFPDNIAKRRSSMDEAQRKKISRRISTGSIVALIIVAVCLGAGLMGGVLTPLMFNIGVGAFLFLYWLANDIVEAKLTRLLEGAALEQRKAYTKYVLFDAVGYIGLAYFAFSIGDNSAGGLFGVLVYAVTMSVKRKQREEFDYLGKVARGEIVPEEEKEEEEETELQKIEQDDVEKKEDK